MFIHPELLSVKKKKKKEGRETFPNQTSLFMCHLLSCAGMLVGSKCMILGLSKFEERVLDFQEVVRRGERHGGYR